MCAQHDGKFHVNKVLSVDVDKQTYHTLTYFPVDEIPTVERLDTLSVYALHSPVADFSNAEKIGRVDVRQEDLQGYHYYLKTTDFDEYCAQTKQDSSEILARANTCFREGYALTDEKRYDEAISKYLETLELFPLFYEAIDNMALVKMTLGRYHDAIDDFRWSLSIEAKNVLAEFSIGECYLRMDNLPEAKEQLERALELEPDDPLTLEFLGKVNEAQRQANLDEESLESEAVSEIVGVSEGESEVLASDDKLDNYLNTPLQDEPENPLPPMKKKWWKLGI